MLTVVVSVILLRLSFAVPSAMGTSIATRAPIEEITDKLVFWDTMAHFQTARSTKDPPDLDWSSDGCSHSPDHPLGFDFLPSCQRHDFAYRNFKAQNRFNHTSKAQIDSNLHMDLYDCCDAVSRWSTAMCRHLADLYYKMVRTLGKKRELREANGI